jgi:hypothetical protein
MAAIGDHSQKFLNEEPLNAFGYISHRPSYYSYIPSSHGYIGYLPSYHQDVLYRPSYHATYYPTYNAHTFTRYVGYNGHYLKAVDADSLANLNESFDIKPNQ